MWRLLRTLEEGRARVAGVLSGTSGDGIDVAIASFEMDRSDPDGPRVASCRLEAFETLPFPGALAPRVRAILDGVAPSLRELAELSRDLGSAFGACARELSTESGLALDLVGSHGLTVYHHDGAPPGERATLQIGDGDHVACAAGCPAVSDFRQGDLAAGGEGAPLSVLADDVVFGAAPRPTSVLNLGGMANLSWLAEDGTVAAFDTGPAGSLLDGFSRHLLHEEFDRDGRAAAQGQVDRAQLARWLEHPFFTAAPPKSTGRDTFGEAWVRGLLARSLESFAPLDAMATAVELVAQTVAMGLRQLPGPSQSLWVAGGGVHNRALMGALERCCGIPVESSEQVGVDPDAREALVFAVLAARCLLGIGVTRPEATGAGPGRILGKISPHER